jgi:hypothetical protein
MREPLDQLNLGLLVDLAESVEVHEPGVLPAHREIVLIQTTQRHTAA